MDTAYVSAVAALAGSTIGGLTSLMATWLTHHEQFGAQQRAANRDWRVELYKAFIDEAAKWYADAYEHDQARVSNLVNLYAMVSRMRVVSSPLVIASAELVIRAIVETYLAPNKTFRDLTELVEHKVMDPLHAFGDACRDELRGPDPE